MTMQISIGIAVEFLYYILIIDPACKKNVRVSIFPNLLCTTSKSIKKKVL